MALIKSRAKEFPKETEPPPRRLRLVRAGSSPEPLWATPDAFGAAAVWLDGARERWRQLAAIGTTGAGSNKAMRGV